jgi:hypothetical protein
VVFSFALTNANARSAWSAAALRRFILTVHTENGRHSLNL